MPATRRQPASNAAKPPPQPASCATSPTRPGRRADWREKTRPTQPLQQHFREKTRPASTKTPILGCFERAGRTFSRTRRDNVATLKPTTPLLAPNKGPLKPTTPLHPKTAPKTPISHPQRRWRFQSRLGHRPQRRRRFQSRLGRHPQRRRRFQSRLGHRPQRQQGFQTTAHLADRARLRSPWATVGIGQATSGRPMLQTSSNQRDSNHLARTPVTNVVNLSPKTTIISEKALRLTTFVTTDQKSTRKTPWIDDVCNNTHQSTPNTQHARPP